ncbi:MAG: Calx-beta domain-containing protein [Pirellulaceae bacterium]
MLAADVVTCAEILSSESAEPDAVSSNHVCSTVLFIDSDLANIAELQQQLAQDGQSVELVLLDPTMDGVRQVTQHLAQRRHVASVQFVTHGAAGEIQLGSSRLSADMLQQRSAEVQAWSKSLAPGADFLLYGCQAAHGAQGFALLNTLAELTGADVAGSTNRSGASQFGGDWQLERAIGIVSVSDTIVAALDASVATALPITIYAAGQTGDEQMQLLIDNVVVQTWSNVSGDATSGIFEAFTHDADGVSADRIRVAFTNDLYDPAAGIDRNLRIDRIEVDGQSFETESSTVYSTGTWLPADGIAPGYRQSETLHGNGYFQYAEQANDGTEIDIHAYGNDGSESMELRIDGVVVQSWTNVGTTLGHFHYTHTSPVTADQVQVAFTNDVYDPANNIDLNLIVDHVALDGQVFETEAPTVYSTGTWLPADGITPGYRQSETLHGNGYFQYADSPASGSEIVILASGATGDENMELRIDNTVVAVWNSVATSPQAYRYVASDTVTAAQVQVAFTNDLWDPANGIDRNLRVDHLQIDGTLYQTEAANVQSTGTYQDGIGVVPGFYQTELLTNNGHFQYDAVAGPPGTIGVLTPYLIFDESAGDVLVTVTRTGGTSGTVRADYSFVSESATIDEDFHGHDGTLTFADGVTQQTIDVSLIEDLFFESDETFRIELSNVTGGATLGTAATQITIVDNDQPVDRGTIQLSQASYQIAENAANVSITIQRVGGSTGAVTVDFATIADSATANQDYTPSVGTLTFADGQTSQTVTIPIVDDTLIEGDERLVVGLSNVTGGATLGTDLAEVIIVDNDTVPSGPIFFDDFEGNRGWQTNPNATDTAITGQWEVADPQSTTASTGNGFIQLGSATSGNRTLVTQAAAGSSVGDFDIDNGITSVLSPVISLPNGAPLQLSFNYYFAHQNNTTADDFLRVSVIGDRGTTVILEERGAAVERLGAWTTASADVSGLGGSNIRILVEAADAGTGSIIEAGLDDVLIEVPGASPGLLSWDVSSSSVNEDANVATLTINRLIGSAGAVQVNYVTQSGTAAAGSDFVSSSGTVQFANGQTSAQVQIPILNDTAPENSESFFVTLSSPTGGAELGSISQTQVEIIDNDVAGYLPDLTPIASTLNENRYVDTTTQPGRALLRISTEVANAGTGPLELWGGAVNGGTQEVYQRIYQAGGGSTDVLAGEFIYHPEHSHIHFEGFALYRLRAINADGSAGAVIAEGGKTSFCLINIRQRFPDATANAGVVHGRGGNTCGSVQGISTGYADVYGSNLPDQWIDITDVASGNYWLEVIADPDNSVIELDETNNSTMIQIAVSNPFGL